MKLLMSVPNLTWYKPPELSIEYQRLDQVQWSWLNTIKAFFQVFFLKRNEFQAAVETTHLLSFCATISNNLFEYFSSRTSCISTSSGMDDTENSEFLLREFPLGKSWSRLPVEKLNAPPRCLEPELGLPFGREESSHCRRRRRNSCIWSSMAENVLEMYDNTWWLSSEGSSFKTWR